MANVAQYRTYIENLLQEYSHYKPSYGDIETELAGINMNESMVVSYTWISRRTKSGYSKMGLKEILLRN